MVASWPKLQCVRAAVRPDVSRSARSSSTASVLNSPVTIVRSSIRWRRARAASKSAWTLANRSSGGREAHSRCAVYAVTADTLLPVMWCSFSAGPEGERWERLQRRATWRGGQDGHSDDTPQIRAISKTCQPQLHGMSKLVLFRSSQSNLSKSGDIDDYNPAD